MKRQNKVHNVEIVTAIETPDTVKSFRENNGRNITKRKAKRMWWNNI